MEGAAQNGPQSYSGLLCIGTRLLECGLKLGRKIVTGYTDLLVETMKKVSHPDQETTLKRYSEYD